MALDVTPEQKQLREREKKCVARMRHSAKQYRQGQFSEKEYKRRLDRFTKDIKAIQEKEYWLGMSLWTIDLG